ncbi:MAG: chlorite dismutase family protein [Acidobacteria bacterium]|nr:chlorite dismutase family protein [Acidobacteriota bacterium]
MSAHEKTSVLAEARQPTTPIKRQYVNFTFFKVDPSWRRLPEEEKARGRLELVNVVERFRDDLLLYTYSLLGLRSDADFMIWRIGDRLETFQDMSAQIFRTGLGKYLVNTYSYLAATKRSIYVIRHQHPGSEGSRLQVVPGEAKYLFVYPFVKSRDWYLLAKDVRQRIMDEHIAVGHRYPTVKINTTYSFGLDDQEFVVAFESDKPHDFLDLVMELRETESSKYTVRDTPVFTCVMKKIDEILESLG